MLQSLFVYLALQPICDTNSIKALKRPPRYGLGNPTEAMLARSLAPSFPGGQIRNGANPTTILIPVGFRSMRRVLIEELNFCRAIVRNLRAALVSMMPISGRRMPLDATPHCSCSFRSERGVLRDKRETILRWRFRELCFRGPVFCPHLGLHFPKSAVRRWLRL